jgi:hypothetical protein
MVNIPKDLAEILRGADKPRENQPIYARDGDCLIYYDDNDRPCHAERLSDLVTIYRADDDGALVGCKIKDIARRLKQFGSFGVMLVGKEVLLGFLFMMVGVEPDGDEFDIFEDPLAQRPVRLPDELCETAH